MFVEAIYKSVEFNILSGAGNKQAGIITCQVLTEVIFRDVAKMRVFM